MNFETLKNTITPEYLKGLSLEELKELTTFLEGVKDSKNISQHSLKIQINALYGAMANKHFLLANPDLAAGITSAGRFFIRFIALRIEQRLQEMIPDGRKRYVTSGDTDSAIFSTRIAVNNSKKAIGDYFNENPNPIWVTPSGNEVKPVTNGDTTKTFKMNEGVIDRPINYIMRHKVKKRMYKITIGNDSVEVTGDHSLMVIRDGKLTEAKPYEIQKGDKMVRIIE